jgi:hypothetical protein
MIRPIFRAAHESDRNLVLRAAWIAFDDADYFGIAAANLTIADLRKILAASCLTFGNRYQIWMVDEIAAAEKLVGLTMKCPECDGGGVETEKTCEDCGHTHDCEEDCDYCDGSGEVFWTARDVADLTPFHIRLYLPKAWLEVRAA